MTYKNNKFQIFKSALSLDVCRVLSREFKMTRDIMNLSASTNKEYPYSDEMVDKSFSWYSPLCFEALSDTLIKDLVSSTIGESVVPTYSYGRIYYEGAELKKHVDRCSSEVAVSVCLDIDKESEPWPLCIENINGITEIVNQEPGDVIIYDGNLLTHWRTTYKGNEHINAFMFYVKEAGPRSFLKYDTRPCLGLGGAARKLDSESQWKTFGHLY
jgi:hypothetical protein